MIDKSNSKRCLVVSALLLSSLCASTLARIIYVDDDAIGANNGSNWENAYCCLQNALGEAQSDDEIRVAQGIYKPDREVVTGRGIRVVASGDRTVAFQLKNGVALRGGYAGLSGPDPNARDISLYETILNGDLNGDDNDVNDPCDLLAEPTRAENSYSVVTGDTDNSLLYGFTISGGNANGPMQTSPGAKANPAEHGWGGGMHLIPSSVTITNCTFRNNSASGGGGGIFSVLGDGPTLNNCIFIWNSGGSVVVEENSAIFKWGAGGGMYNSDCNATLTGCIFTANSTKERGGGMENTQSNLTLTNCTFSGNSAYNDFFSSCGGGINSLGGDTIILTNCTFAQNSALRGNALCDYNLAPSNIKLINCILWDGVGSIWHHSWDPDYDSTITITYSNIQGGWSGEGNIDIDPCFADPGIWANVNDPNVAVEPNDPNAVWIDGDYHLKSQAGRWDPNSLSWIVDDVTSPCIDAGDPNSPIGHEPFPNGGIINMGAYGGTEQASKSPSNSLY